MAFGGEESKQHDETEETAEMFIASIYTLRLSSAHSENQFFFTCLQFQGWWATQRKKNGLKM